MKVSFAKPARRYLSKCSGKVRTALIAAVEGLPDKGDIRKLKGQVIEDTYRLRVGRYRIIYVREDEEIRVLDIQPRGDIY